MYEEEINIKVVCHGSNKNFPQKIMIDNTKYEDICQPPVQNAAIAYLYSTYDYAFALDTEGNMEEYELYPVTGWYTHIPWHYEILKSFFINYHLTPKWIYSDQLYGHFDVSTGHWTGVMGKVETIE